MITKYILILCDEEAVNVFDRLLVSALEIAIMPPGEDRLEYVTCKVWDSPKDISSFPELGDPEYGSEDLKSRPNVGLAFSGGGTRSAAATLGQLRGLSALGLLEKVRYISCVSGAAFTCIPFIYLPDNQDDRTFLGPVVPPGKVTIAQLESPDGNGFVSRIADTVILDELVRNAAWKAGDETYARALGDIFLRPVGLGSLQRFFSYDQTTVAEIMKHNCHMTESDFYTVRPGRPYLIVNTIIIRLWNERCLPKRIHYETTPLYTGAPVLHKGAGAKGRDIGGGYIEPFGFDSDAPESPSAQSSRVRVRLECEKHRYSLSDVMGTTGAAQAEKLVRYGLGWLGLQPRFKYWLPGGSQEIRTEDYVFGDGGILENLGIMALLRRKVRRIVVFVNTKSAVIGPKKGQINDSIPPLFGQTPCFMTNHVFPKEKYCRLVNQLILRRSAGRSVIFQDEYSVLENTHYGIEGGWSVEVMWVYNEEVKAWERQLPAEVRARIEARSFGNFPHYSTFFENFPTIIDLSSEQAALLAHLSCWNVTENAAVFWMSAARRLSGTSQSVHRKLLKLISHF